MARPSSRQELIDFCLRKLGAPVIEINIDEDQVEDRVDEALQQFAEFHTDSVIHAYFKHQLTQEEVDNKYITLFDRITYVKRVIPDSVVGTARGMFGIEYQMFMTDALDMRNIGNLSNYVQTKQYLSLMDMVLDSPELFRFNRHMNRLYMDADWANDLVADSWIVIECMAVVDPELYTDVYNDPWLKRYTTALIKQQWGANLIKFDGMQLPGGVTLNGRQMFDDAQAEIQDLEVQIRNTYELPVDFYTG